VALNTWHFIDDTGAFHLDDPQKTSYLYFPLVNEAGMMSAVTPVLHGDAKTGQHTFLMPPVSVEDLHNTRSGRNFWVNVPGSGSWSAAGASARQLAGGEEPDQVFLEAGFLWQRLTRTWMQAGQSLLRAECTNLVPHGEDQVELMKVVLSNTGTQPLTLVPTAAIPIYARSADNLRDHRHVTSLLQRITCHPAGVTVCPSLSFDERGHRPNTTSYAVLGVEGEGGLPESFFPVLEDFVGEGGSLDWPAAVVDARTAGCPAGTQAAGYEAMGALRFREVTLAPGETRTYVLILAVLGSDDASLATLLERYGSRTAFDTCLVRTQAYWTDRLADLDFHSGEQSFDRWLKWVSLQPILRRMFGNSFLPYHDYGRGGRGWRDLWQDILALLVMQPEHVDKLLLSNFAGVRVDGSNANIIGSRPGEFKADRNNIPRTWMDHGAWPFLTTRLYIHQSGDVEFLLREQVYFKDRMAFRSQDVDPDWEPGQGTLLRTRSGEVYSGTILEHVLVQHLTAFFNVGEHNNLKLEGGDWNDAMDMGAQRGESVAFSAMYAGHLRELAGLVLELGKKQAPVELAKELLLLLDTLGDPLDYASAPARQARLQAYFSAVRHALSGQKVCVSAADLAADLTLKADCLYAHLRSQEWMRNSEGYAWFNGYYDNDGQRLEGDHPLGVRMTLTGQVFPLMSGVATLEQAREIVRSVDHYLYDARLGGPRLNTDFKAVLLNMGRCFGFPTVTKRTGLCSATWQ
jgi:cellobiose phosphorylase